MAITKYGMETEPNHTYRSCMKYCLKINKCEHADSMKLLGYVRQI